MNAAIQPRDGETPDDYIVRLEALIPQLEDESLFEDWIHAQLWLGYTRAMIAAQDKLIGDLTRLRPVDYTTLLPMDYTTASPDWTGIKLDYRPPV